MFSNLIIVSFTETYDIPPEAFIWPPPLKYSFAISLTFIFPFDLKESLTTSPLSTIKTGAITYILLQ